MTSVEETERQHTGDLGFFSVLYNVSDAAFGGRLYEHVFEEALSKALAE